MKYPGLILFLFCVLVVAGSRAGIIDPRCQRSTEGTEFWFGFMEGRSSSDNHYVEVTVTSRLDATFSIYIGDSDIPFDSLSHDVLANGSVQIRIPFEMVEPEGSEVIMPMGIRLSADNPVNVYALNHDNNSSDVAVIYPVGSLGNEYLTMCYKPHIYITDRYPIPDPEHGRNSEFVVVAAENNTTVKITPTAEPDSLNTKGKEFTINLNKGDLYQVQSLIGDLTGSKITSDKPVAVFSGSFSTTIPFETPNGGWDHLYEQMPPVTTWGREYYTVPLSGRSKDYFRVMASQPNTTFFVENIRYTLTAAGDFREFSMNAPSRIFADKSILIAQFSQSKSNDGVQNGDGFMVVLSPVSQAKNDVTFVAYESTLMKEYYVNIVVPVSETGNIMLNETLLSPDLFTTYSNGRYASMQYQINSGPNRLSNTTNPTRGFIAYVYGFGGNEAYGYGVGFNLNLVLDLSESLTGNPNLSLNGDTLVFCKGDRVLLDAGPYFDYYEWNIDLKESTVMVSEEGFYKVEAGTSDRVCKQTDSILLVVDDPLPIDLGGDKTGCPNSSVDLDAGDGFSRYEWVPGHETTRKIVADTTGFYSVTAYDKYGCPAEGSMQFTIQPVVDFEVNYPVALLDHANLEFTNLSRRADSYQWDFGDGGISHEKHPEHQYTSLGNFQATLIAYSGSCSDTISRNIEILPFDVYAPNAFRPDSPIAENRTFIPFTLGVDPAFFHLQIYNRWGEMIFESKNMQHPWDGKTRNGQNAPTGNYIWKADYTDVQGFSHSRKGQVVLVR